jgi:hypothetical protein
MSSNLECDIVGLTDGRWFYVLQSWSCPAGAWDWRDEDPSVGGPFSSAEAASDGLMRKHSNPGGHNEYQLTIEEAVADPVLKKNIERALRRPLEVPDLPDIPVEVGAVLVQSRHGGSKGIYMRTGRDDEGRATVKQTENFTAHALSEALISAQRDVSGIAVTIDHDAQMPDEMLAMLEDEIIARARLIYPEELTIRARVPRPEPEENSPSF